jgi:2,4-dienoyl-CoA reductase-like NADH-dependent reductase (Old Yellow Enzyme family)
MTLFTSFTLPNGIVLKNRIAKAAMEENMADRNHAPSKELIELYQRWAKGGSDLLITGNVMVNHKAMTGPNGVILEDDEHIDQFIQWSKQTRQSGSHIVMQINHPGRQMQAALGQETIAPSAVALEMGAYSNKFSTPKEMTLDDINDIISSFVKTAKLAENSGFSGVQIHAAHGYLISQFLSPLTNRRLDQWGGNIVNRARLLLEIIQKVRATVSPQFIVAVKLNSADFQKGGFSVDDAQTVVEMLNQEKIDFVELSGGSYESPAMQGQTRENNTTLAREAYFLEFAEQIMTKAQMPIMVTGGIKSQIVAEKVIQSGISLVGIATALAIEPELPNLWKKGIDPNVTLPTLNWKNKVLASLARMAIVKYQLKLHSKGKKSNIHVLPIWAFLVQQFAQNAQTKRYKKWVSTKI